MKIHLDAFERILTALLVMVSLISAAVAVSIIFSITDGPVLMAVICIMVVVCMVLIFLGIIYFKDE